MSTSKRIESAPDMSNTSHNESADKRRPPSWVDPVLSFYDGRAADAWFTWVEWLLVSGALYAVAKAADSMLFTILAYFSALLIILYTATRIEAFLKPLATRTHKLSPVFSWALLLLIIVGQFAVLLALGKVVDTMLSSTVKLD
jgi:hypothetical protein